MTVESKQCRSCFGANYDESNSTSWNQAANSKVEKVKYLSGEIEGVTGKDKVCLSESGNCADPFEFFLIQYNEMIPPEVDGILGMCAGGQIMSTKKGDDSESDDEDWGTMGASDEDGKSKKYEMHENGPDLVDALYDSNMITEKTFSFYLADEDETSYVDFGPARSTGMSAPLKIKYLTLEENFFWLGQFGAVRFGAEEEQAYAFEKDVKVVYDTGSSLTLVPKSIAKPFFRELLMDKDFVMWDGAVIVGCETDMWDSVYLLTGDNYWVEYRPEDYIMPVPDMPGTEDEGICMLGFFPTEMNFWLAGNNFHRGYYSVHKKESFELGLVPHSTSLKEPVTKGLKPMQKLQEQQNYANFMRNSLLFGMSFALWIAYIELKVIDFEGTADSTSFSSLKAKLSKKTEEEN